MAKRKSIKVKAEAALKDVPGVSPNPMTNLVIADLLLRGGGQLLRHAVERNVLGIRFSKDKAAKLIKGRSMTQTLIGTAIARIATRSVPGAILVGGGLLAKTLYDRRHGAAAEAEGKAEIADQVEAGKKA